MAPRPASALRSASTIATATANDAGRRAPAHWTCASRSSGRAATSRPSWNHGRRAETAAEKALVAVVQEAYVQGVSTRSVDELVKAMGMTGISKSQVSRLCTEIDERVDAFLERPIEGEWPYLWLDATYVKVRRAGRIVSAAVIVAVGANTAGRREVLGLSVGPSEAEPFWTDFLRGLARRGLRFEKLATLMDDVEADVLAFMSFPRDHHTKIHSTNPLERVNKEIKRRTNVVGIFPNEAAIVRLVGAILIEQNDEWAVARRYMTLETIAPLGDAADVTPPAIAAA